MGLRIGVIGVGGLGYLQAKTYRELEEVTIVAAADVAADARDLFENEFGAPAYQNYRALLDEHAAELDAVTIVTPHTLHYDQAMACLDHDLHLLIEKPMVTDVQRAVDIIERATDRGLVVQIGYQRHFHPAFEQMRYQIESGTIGEIKTINCFISQNWIENHRNTWRVDPDFAGGGQLYDTGSHLLEALLWLTDAQPGTVTAQIDYEKPDLDVNSAVTIELERDGRSTLATASITGDGDSVIPTEGYFIWGTEGSLAYVDDVLHVIHNDYVSYSAEIPSEFSFEVLNERKLQNFVDSIYGTADPAVPAQVGLEVAALTEAIYKADETGSRVDVDAFIDEYLHSSA
ncbi:MAG: Gfo/Idh/MocA family protein [Halorientalis sp.]